MIVYDETDDLFPESMVEFEAMLDIGKREMVAAFRREMSRPESPLMRAAREIAAKKTTPKL